MSSMLKLDFAGKSFIEFNLSLAVAEAAEFRPGNDHLFGHNKTAH